MFPVIVKLPPLVVTKEPPDEIVMVAAESDPLEPNVRLPPEAIVMANPVLTTAALMVTAVLIVTVALLAGNVPLGQGEFEVVLFQSPAPAEV